jgi:bacterioferritin
VNQYWVHARMCENWGYQRLWHKIRAEAIDEMKHADILVHRILYLEGMPNLQRLGNIKVGETVQEQLELDLAREQSGIPQLNQGIALCADKGDHGSFHLLTEILVSEEEHADWLTAQLELIKQLGAAHYLAQQIKKDDG